MVRFERRYRSLHPVFDYAQSEMQDKGKTRSQKVFRNEREGCGKHSNKKQLTNLVFFFKWKDCKLV